MNGLTYYVSEVGTIFSFNESNNFERLNDENMPEALVQFSKQEWEEAKRVYGRNKAQDKKTELQIISGSSISGLSPEELVQEVICDGYIYAVKKDGTVYKRVDKDTLEQVDLSTEKNGNIQRWARYNIVEHYIPYVVRKREESRGNNFIWAGKIGEEIYTLDLYGRVYQLDGDKLHFLPEGYPAEIEEQRNSKLQGVRSLTSIRVNPDETSEERDVHSNIMKIAAEKEKMGAPLTIAEIGELAEREWQRYKFKTINLCEVLNEKAEYKAKAWYGISKVAESCRTKIFYYRKCRIIYI